MQGEEFLRTLDKAKAEPVYLFVGSSDFLMEEAWRKLLAKLLPGGAKNFNGERAQARETPAGQVIERLATVPMFGAGRLFMVEHVEAWGKEDRASLESFLPRIPASACLVLTSSARKGIEALAKSVEAKGKVVQFRDPAEREAPRWLMERAREKGKTLSLRAALLLVDTAGSAFSHLASELEKICTFVGQRDRIEPEDIEQAVSPNRTYSMFDLFDQIRTRQAGKAITSLRSLIAAGEPPLKILSSLAWQIRTLWQVKDGLRLGFSEPQLAQRLKLHAFAVKKASEQAALFCESDLREIHEAIRRTDVAVKSTGSPPELLLESLLIDLCLETQKPPETLRGL